MTLTVSILCAAVPWIMTVYRLWRDLRAERELTRELQDEVLRRISETSSVERCHALATCGRHFTAKGAANRAKTGYWRDKKEIGQ